MEKIIVFIDDAAYARQLLAPMRSPGTPTQWILVACAPRMSRHISKWVSHSARKNWRARWAEKQFQELVPMLSVRPDSVVQMVAESPLQEFAQKLLADHSNARLLDARRPKLAHDRQPVSAETSAARAPNRWELPGAVAGLGAMLVLAAE